MRYSLRMGKLEKLKAYVTVKQAAEDIGVHESLIRRWIKDGRMQASNLGSEDDPVLTIIHRSQLAKMKKRDRRPGPRALRNHHRCKFCKGRFISSRLLTWHAPRCKANPDSMISRGRERERCPHCSGWYFLGVGYNRHVEACARRKGYVPESISG